MCLYSSYCHELDNHLYLSLPRAKVLRILCDEEGYAVSSGLSAYFGDSEETVSEAVANEKAFPVLVGGYEGPLSDVLVPPEVGLWLSGKERL